MPAPGWVQVGTEPGALKDADSIAATLSHSALKVTRAQVLRGALALGLRALKARPAALLEAGAPAKPAVKKAGRPKRRTRSA